MFWARTTPCTVGSTSKLKAVGSLAIQRKTCVKAQTPVGDNKVLYWGWKEWLWSLGGHIIAISVLEWQLVGVLQSCHITALSWGNWEHFEGLCKTAVWGLQWLSPVKAALQAKVLGTKPRPCRVEGEHWRLFGILPLSFTESLAIWKEPSPPSSKLSPSFWRLWVPGNVNTGVSQSSASAAGICWGEIHPAKQSCSSLGI